MDRRELLQVGFSGLLGLGLGTPPRSAGAPKAKKVLMIFLTGAPSHIDTFDPKPDAPEEIRGLFKPIADERPRDSGLRAPAADRGADRQVRDRPVDDPPGAEARARHPLPA